LTDEELVQAARDGDEDAFRELVERFEPVVAATVIGMLGDCAEAEDVGQETFIRFYRGLKSFRGESSVKTYLTRIAMNLSLNELKRRKKRRLRFTEKPVEDHRGIVDRRRGPGEDVDKELVWMAIGQLDQKFRSVVVLRLIDGYSTGETAEILGLPAGTVLSRLARGQKKLKEILEPHIGVRS
jgi:RNA polymerase sigma-70 factor (ECF subfamily)